MTTWANKKHKPVDEEPKKKLSPLEAYGFPPRGEFKEKQKPVDEELDSSMTAPKNKKIDPAQPETIKEAINDLQTFLECDLYSKFRPEQKIPSGKKGKIEVWYRKDVFKNEKEFAEYLDAHFKILKEEIVRIIGKQRYKHEKN
jgi:hypothetical protein